MLNKIMLIGNVGRDPEMSYTPSGSAVTKFSLAVTRRWNDKASGAKKDETTWFNIVAWEKLAEICSQYVHKGSKLYIEGRIQTREYTDKDGIKRNVFDVVMTDMQMLDSKKTESSDQGDARDAEDFPF